MNKWIRKSIELANQKNYLDLIFGVYPISEEKTRELKLPKEDIIQSYKNKDALGLIRSFLKLKKFPINDPYVAALRKYPFLLSKNPKTIKRIGKKLFSIKINNLLNLTIQAKSPSRQFGQSFHKWLSKINYPFLKYNDFKTYKNTAFLNENDEDLKVFALKELKIKNLDRRPDFILKIKDKFIIGEAKFLTDYGGTQNNQFDGAIEITKLRTDKISGVAVLDGITWFKSNNYIFKKIEKLKGAALSALLLKDFIIDLNKK